MTGLREAALQALEALKYLRETAICSSDTDTANEVIPALEDALAQQAEPEVLTIERLRDALVASRIIPPAAVEDPDGYDDGVTLSRIEALHRRLTA